MNMDERRSFIECLEQGLRISGEDISRILKLKNDPDPEIRVLLAQALVFQPADIAESVLLEMIDDEELLVRINACDSLSIGISENTVTALCRKARQDCYLVRGYALMSLADVVQNRSDAPESILPFLKKAYFTEKSGWVKGACAYSLCLLGESSYLVYLLKDLNHRIYQRRCAAVHLLTDLIEHNCMEDMELVKSAVIKRYQIESSIAVRSSIERFIKALEVHG